MDVREWARSALELRVPPALSTLRTLFNGPAPVRSSNPASKTQHNVTCPPLEAALVYWISICERMQLPLVNQATIRAKAAKIRESIMKDPTWSTSTALAQLTFSNGWLEKLQRRHGLKSRRVHGEAASASADDVKRGREELLRVTRNFEKRDTFNMDESAFFYCMVPSTSVSKNSMAGRKNIKKRITVAITSNADGSIKMPLLFVGTARQPRCFKGKTGEELGLQYRCAPKGWMNTQLFQGWLGNFNETMKNEGRHVLLLLDNASCHRGHDGLSNVKVHMLPPNTTAHLQPQDAGIIRSFKSRVNNIKNRYYVDQLDALLEQALSAGKESVESSTDFFQVDILVAMRWAQEAWESVTSITVNNCWRHTGILDEGFYELVESMEKMRMSPLSIRLSA